MSFEDRVSPDEIQRAMHCLAAGGVELVLRFSDDKLALLRGWPSPSEVSEAELRGELETAIDEIRDLRQRLEALAARLPKPTRTAGVEAGTPADVAALEAGLVAALEDVPTVYRQLVGALDYLTGEAIPEIESVVDGALAATPESLRAEWLQGHFPASVGLLMSLAAENPEGRTEPDAGDGRSSEPTTTPPRS